MQYSEQIPTRLENHTHLTPREHDVVILISEGMTGKEIAWHLGISPKMVARVRSDIRIKWDVKSVAQLLQRAIRMGIIKS